MPFLTFVLRWLERLFSLKTLRRKFVIGFIIASVVAVGNIVVIHSLLRQSDTIAATINIAGKMRMLSQRIGLMHVAERNLPPSEDWNTHTLYEQLETNFQAAITALKGGGKAFDLAIPAIATTSQQHLEKIEVSWDAYRQTLAAMKPNRSPLEANAGSVAHDQAATLAIIATSTVLLEDIEALINSLIQQSDNMQASVKNQVYGLFIANVLMLLLAWAIIVCKVLNPIKQVMQLGNELAAGNYDARLHMNSSDEFGSLSRVLNKSAAHIENLLRDLKVKQNTLKKARAGLRRAVLVYQHISDGVVITDADGFIQDINPAFSTITGYTAAEVVGHRMNKLSSGRHSKEFFRSFWERLSTTGQWHGDIWNKHKSGEEFISHLMINSCFNDDGTVDCRIGLFSNVTEQRTQEALIWRQAHFDHLTQLPNRLMFHENLHASIEQSKRSGFPFALIFLDLDLFKEVNDTFGHDEGDALLKQVAQRISDCCRRSDQVARLGGDEFVMIIQDLKSHDDIHPICEKILGSVSKPYSLAVSDIRISCSMGVAFYPDDADNATDLLKYVDFAMYAAKERGRNQYCLFSRTLRDSVQLRHDLLRDFQAGLDTQQFILHYQPIIDLQTGNIIKAEALIRWQHPTLGLIPPGDFIPLAEDSGLIIPLGDSIFQQAAKQAALWRDNMEHWAGVSINVSPAQFQQSGLDPETWIQTLQNLDLPNSAITLEITERLLLESDEDIYEKIRTLRRAGFQIALDDFGTGYSSLSYLRRVDIDIIKIDQSFVRNLAESPENMVLCNAIINMSHELGLKVVAEGIETPEQHDLLLAAGCDFGQGYLYSRPVAADQFSEWLEAYSQPS